MFYICHSHLEIIREENEHDQPTRIRRAGIQHTDKHLDTAEKDQLFSVRDDDEFIHVHIKERQDEPEDSDFVREFERTMTETMQVFSFA